VTVGRSHIFSLDEAVLTGEVIASAASGLPRRIRPKGDIASVLALGPSGLWRFGEAADAWADSVGGNNAAMVGVGGGLARAVAGSPVVDDGDLAVNWINGANYACANAPTVLAAQHPRYGIGFTSSAWFVPTQAGGYSLSLGSANSGLYPGAGGWRLFIVPSSGPIGTASLEVYGAGSGLFAANYTGSLVGNDNAMRYMHVAWTWDGTYSSALYGVSLWVNGVFVPFTGVVQNNGFTSQPSLQAPGGLWFGGVPAAGNAVAAPRMTGYMDEVSVFPRALSAAEILTLYVQGANLQKRARWALPFAAAATVTSLEIPGYRSLASLPNPGAPGLPHDIAETPHRTFLSVDGGATRTEVTPGSVPTYPVSSGQTLTLDVDTTWAVPGKTPRPFIGDSLGGGPAVLYEEADPAHPANATAVRSTFGAIEIDFDHGIESTVQPTNDPLPALQLGAASIVDGTTLRLEHEGMLTVAEPLAVTVEDLSALRVTVQDLDQLRVTVED
jgi:hypothetical protein